MIEPLHVIGHLNPDTDAIASAMGYAWLLRERDGRNAIAARAGAINPQTAWVLKTIGLEAPRYLPDASPRFERIARTLPPVLPDRPLREAWAVAAAGRTGAPVVEGSGRPLGLVTGNSVFRFLSRQMDERVDLENVSVARILSVPCRAAMDENVPCFNLATRVRDAVHRVVRDERDDFFVTREDGTYFGIARTPDILNPPRLRVILVDHNEASQALGALEEAELVEVLDHHRLGNSPTTMPIPFIVDPVGSTSTLVAERVLAAGLVPSSSIAGLLLAGLLSDTLILKSPTTTPRDHAAAKCLGEWALDTAEVPYGSIVSFGEALLAAGAGLTVHDVGAILNSDLKIYEAGEFKFGIAQAEVANRHELDERLEALQAGLEDMCEARGLGLAVLMVTDVVRGASRLVLAGQHVAVLDDLPYVRRADGTLDAPDVVSRKKQLLPAILGLLG
jgi:manganese-dependent inorganic pyrophosphatase